jgi:hypothetical protein
MTDSMPLRVVQTSDDLVAAALPPAAPARSGREPVSVPLAVPIEAHGHVVEVVTLRPLKVADIQELPFDPLNRVKIDPAAINGYLVRLGDIPASSVAQLDPGDWFELAMTVVGFFGKRAPTS